MFTYRVQYELARPEGDGDAISGMLMDGWVAYAPNNRFRLTFGQRASLSDNLEMRTGSQSLHLIERSRLTSAFSTIREFGLFAEGRVRAESIRSDSMMFRGAVTGWALLLSATGMGQTSALELVGVVHGPLGGAPKALELYALESIADLSEYSLSTANNGTGSAGPEWTFPPVSVAAGTSITVSKEVETFAFFFNAGPDFVDDGLVCNFNGNDAIELLRNNIVVDGFGDPTADGTGSTWEYTLGWAYRNCEAGWTIEMGAMSGVSTNAESANPFPLGSFEIACAPAVPGCTLPHADNFNPEATEEDGGCLLDA